MYLLCLTLAGSLTALGASCLKAYDIRPMFIVSNLTKVAYEYTNSNRRISEMACCIQLLGPALLCREQPMAAWDGL